MLNFITLLGVEDVRSAGCSMKTSASTIQSAASQVEDSLQRHRMFLSDWLYRFEEAVKKLREEEKD